MNTTAHTPTPSVTPTIERPWAAFITDTESGFGFGNNREWGLPLFKLYNGTPDQIDDVVCKLNAYDSLKAQNEELVEALRDLHVTLTGPGTRNDRISGAVVFIAAALAGVTP